MVCVSHTVVVAPVPRTWFADTVALLERLAGDSRAEGDRVVLPDGRTVPDVRLAAGRHLRPGAEYVVQYA
ncbi:hypothetical protein ACFYTE_04115, partial [Streptomyces sp. NPDC004629]